MHAPSQKFNVLRLAAAHLRHEWVLTACLVSALAAVLAPLLVLLGLKEGVIATLRERLVEDPVYREIRPAATQVYDSAFFAALRNDPRVAFVTPTILPASSMIYLRNGGGEGALFDLAPSAAGDPLLLENGGVIPEEGQCVLSAEAARLLGVRVGDRLEAKATRSRGGRSEAGVAELTVAAVLAPRAGSLPRVYAPLGFVLDVESYKEGRAAPARGWAGESPRPYLSYQGAAVITREALDPITRTGLAVNTGLLQAAEEGAEDFRRHWGIPLQAVARKLRGRAALLLPDAGNLSLHWSGREFSLVGLSLSPEEAAELGLPELPWGRWQPGELSPERIAQALGPADGNSGEARFAGQESLLFPLRRVGDAPGAQLLVPAELTGLLRTAAERRVGFDPAAGGFLLERPGFRGFRLYARGIDDVPWLVAELRRQGIQALAEVEAIERIRTLDRGLTRLFWLIALLGVLGAGAVLVASLYAAVERERKDLGVLRLIGLARGDVFWFPLFQGGIIAVLGVAVAIAGYAGLGLLINQVFGQDLAPGEEVCRLPDHYPPLALLFTLLLALLSALLAAWRATRIEPAEAIREE